jgi:SPP1 family predicted phage head-tail adaptor
LKVIAAGLYRHRINIERPTSESDPLGQSQIRWRSVLVGVSALVEDLNGRELLAAQEVHSAVNTRMRLRYRAQIVAGMRVIFRGAVYTVETVIRPDALLLELHLMCSAGLIE